MSEVVHYDRIENVGLLTVDNPPVNALSHAVRQGIQDTLDQFIADDSAAALLLICAGRTFIAGADITEFNQPVKEPWLPGLIDKIEHSPKLVVAALHGTALGGGFETALGCHYRCAVASARVGFPEVTLGLLPGAGGTQRLPRITGVEKALDMILSGKPLPATEARECGIIDAIIEGDLREGALAYVKQLLEENAPLRRTSELEIDRSGIDAGLFAHHRQQIEKQQRGFFSPGRILKCIEAACELPFDEAMKLERELFDECKASSQSRAQRYLFFAERNAAKIPDIPAQTPIREIDRVAVIGAGTMGGGIAMNFANAGIPVTLLEVRQDALDRGLGIIHKNYASGVSKGRMSEEQLEERMALIQGVLDYEAIAGADLVIEAVFENMDIKQQVFRKLDEVCVPDTILATNTSTLDVNKIAAVTSRSQDVIGLHFFAPANIMPLLEIVRGAESGKEVIATSMALAKRIRKIGVLVGVCFGFVGNRMFMPYIREAQLMMLEGVAPERVDQVMYDWGMAMGPHAVFDLSGTDVFYKLNQEWQERPSDPTYCRMGTILYEMGRLGQKTGAGIYKYDGRKPVPDPEVMAIARKEAGKLGIEQRDIRDEEIIERLLYSMINEAAKILEEGIAQRPGDIDVIYTNGYGVPRYRGGPMFYADTVGSEQIYDAICRYRDRYGTLYWTPAPLLERLAKAGKTFAEWDKEPVRV
ncbi:MAG: 3-hydroxyacyl-CoA dehydrogenase NAD-binding domain-containing protein [Gammaproteobacteria bacterium]